MCPTSSSSPTFPCASSATKPFPTPGAPACTAAATAFRVAYRFLADGEIGIHDERWLTYPWGVLGGDPGSAPQALVRTDGSEQWLPAKVEGVKVKAGDLLYFNTWGGGGWGDPYARDPELVRRTWRGAW
jgi:N-methylhydantoinase B